MEGEKRGKGLQGNRERKKMQRMGVARLRFREVLYVSCSCSSREFADKLTGAYMSKLSFFCSAFSLLKVKEGPGGNGHRLLVA